MDYKVKIKIFQLYTDIFIHCGHKQFSAKNFPAIFGTQALP